MSRPSVLKAFWIAIRRSPRDRRARGLLVYLVAFGGAFLFYLIILGVWIAVTYFPRLAWSLPGLASVIGLFLLIIATLGVAVSVGLWSFYSLKSLLLRKLHCFQEHRQQYLDKALTRSLYREAALIGVLLRRLSSERAMEKELPPEIQVTTRRFLLDQLQTLGLRESLGPELLDVLLAPDGHWSMELKHRAEFAWELFDVLRWELGLGELRPLTSLPKYNFADAAALLAVEAPDKLVAKPSWDIRPWRDGSERFFHRCAAELLARRELQHAEESDVLQAIEAREQVIDEGYTADYLVGAQTITELPTPLLWSFTLRAHRRAEALKLLVDVTSGEANPSTLRALYAQQFRLNETSDLGTEH